MVLSEEEEEEEEEDMGDEDLSNEVDLEQSKSIVEQKKASTKEIKREPKSEPEVSFMTYSWI